MSQRKKMRQSIGAYLNKHRMSGGPLNVTILVPDIEVFKNELADTLLGRLRITSSDDLDLTSIIFAALKKHRNQQSKHELARLIAHEIETTSK